MHPKRLCVKVFFYKLHKHMPWGNILLHTVVWIKILFWENSRQSLFNSPLHIFPVLVSEITNISFVLSFIKVLTRIIQSLYYAPAGRYISDSDDRGRSIDKISSGTPRASPDDKKKLQKGTLWLAIIFFRTRMLIEQGE